MPRDYKAEYARRQERAAAKGTTVYAERVARPSARGATRAEARGHGRAPIAQLRETGILAARLRPPDPATGQPVLTGRELRTLRATPAPEAYRLLESLYPDKSLSNHQRYSLAFGYAA